VVVSGEATLSGVPDPTYVPPQLPVYHFSVSPDPPVAERLMLPASSAQKLFRSTEAVVGATGSGFTVTSR
jgi:hypothetical protein